MKEEVKRWAKLLPFVGICVVWATSVAWLAPYYEDNHALYSTTVQVFKLDSPTAPTEYLPLDPPAFATFTYSAWGYSVKSEFPTSQVLFQGTANQSNAAQDSLGSAMYVADPASPLAAPSITNGNELYINAHPCPSASSGGWMCEYSPIFAASIVLIIILPAIGILGGALLFKHDRELSHQSLCVGSVAATIGYAIVIIATMVATADTAHSETHVSSSSVFQWICTTIYANIGPATGPLIDVCPAAGSTLAATILVSSTGTKSGYAAFIGFFLTAAALSYMLVHHVTTEMIFDALLPEHRKEYVDEGTELRAGAESEQLTGRQEFWTAPDHNAAVSGTLAYAQPQ
jgi:hypothetical protein